MENQEIVMEKSWTNILSSRPVDAHRENKNKMVEPAKVAWKGKNYISDVQVYHRRGDALEVHF